MADENSFFIQVLSDHLNERKTIPPAIIDWSIIFQSMLMEVSSWVFLPLRKSDNTRIIILFSNRLIFFNVI